MPTAYDDENVFARVLRGDLPSHAVFEDDVALGFMDVMPRVDGHVLVIPKIPARNLLDITPEQLAVLMPRVQRVAIAAGKAMRADGLTVQQFNEEAGGQVVFHLHFHVLPRHAGVAMRPVGAPMADQGLLGEQAERIRAALRQ